MDRATYLLLKKKIDDIDNTEKITAATEAWLEDNVSPETGYVLDRSLTLNDAAAPADMVGDLKSSFDDIAEEVITPISFTEIKRKLIDGSGAATDIASDAYMVSDFIEVEEGETYYITASANYNNSLYAWYNSEKTFISKRGTGGSGSTVIVATDEEAKAPTNAAYLRIGYISPTVGSVKKSDGYKSNLADDVEELKKITPIPSKVKITKSGTNLTIVDVDSGIYLTASTIGSNNGAFNILNYFKSNGSVYKNAGDDIAPIYYDGSHRCGNHGNIVCIAVTASSHGLTESDIGKVVTSENNIDYVIIRIVDTDNFWIVNDSETRTFNRTIPTSPLAGNGLSVAFSSASLTQIWPGINNKYLSISCDDTTITDDGTYEGYNISIVEGYYSIDTLEMLSVLKENVGSNTNSSYYADTLSDDLLYETQYSFSAGLKTIISGTIVILRDNVNLTSWGVTQSQAIASAVQSYVPDSTDEDISLISGSNTYPPTAWLDSNFPPYKFFQFDNSDTTKGFAIVYDIGFEDAIPEKRKSNVYNSYTCPNPYKMYPFIISKNTDNFLSAGTVIKATAIRMFISKNKPLVVSYEVGGETHIDIDTFSDGVNIVNIGKVPDNCKYKVLHTSSGVTVLDNISTSGLIRIYGKGSVSVVIES